MLSIDVNNKCIYCTDFSNETIFAFLVVDISIPPQGVMTMIILMLLAIHNFTKILSSILFACIVSEPVGDTKLEFECLDFIHKNSHIFIRNMTIEIPAT